MREKLTTNGYFQSAVRLLARARDVLAKRSRKQKIKEEEKKNGKTERTTGKGGRSKGSCGYAGEEKTQHPQKTTAAGAQTPKATTMTREDKHDIGVAKVGV